MTHIICRANFCLFWEQGVCSAEEIEYEPDNGCLTFQDIGDLNLDEGEEEFDWEDESEDDLFEDEEEDNWEESEEEWEEDEF
jgi:hypothetical protein